MFSRWTIQPIVWKTTHQGAKESQGNLSRHHVLNRKGQGLPKHLFLNDLFLGNVA